MTLSAMLSTLDDAILHTQAAILSLLHAAADPFLTASTATEWAVAGAAALCLGAAALALGDFIVMNWDKNRPYWRWPFLRDIPVHIRHEAELNDWKTTTYKQLVARTGRQTMVVYFAGSRCVCVAQPSDVEYVLKTNWENYMVSTGVRGDTTEELLGHGIVRVDGSAWHAQRKTAAREFSVNNYRNVMLPQFIAGAKKLTALLLPRAQSGEVVEISDLFFRMAFDAIVKISCGLNAKSLEATTAESIGFATSFDAAQAGVAHRMVVPAWVWKLQRKLNIGDERVLQRHIATVRGFIANAVRERIRVFSSEKSNTSSAEPDDEDRTDLLSRLMTICIDENIVPVGERAAYLEDMIVSFLFAGRDTTGASLSWLFFELSRHPEVQRKVVDELATTCPAGVVSYDGLLASTYLHAVVHESLRLYPPIPFDPKNAKSDDVIPSSGEKVHAGDIVAFMPYVTHRLESVWGPDAEEFRPERWIDPATGAFLHSDPYRFSTFQAGPRRCLGVDMAVIQIKATAAVLLSALEVVRCVNKPTHRGHCLIMAPRKDLGGVQVILKPRRV